MNGAYGAATADLRTQRVPKKWMRLFFWGGGGDLRRKRVHDGVDAVGDKPKKEKRCGALRVW